MTRTDFPPRARVASTAGPRRVLGLEAAARLALARLEALHAETGCACTAAAPCAARADARTLADALRTGTGTSTSTPQRPDAGRVTLAGWRR